MIYYVLMCLLFLFSFSDLTKNSRLKLSLYITSYAILVFFGGLRYDTGWDFATYHYYFEQIGNLGELINNGFYPDIYFELGFKILVSTLKSLGLGFQSLLFICNLFVLSAVYYFCYKSTSLYNTAILIYFCTCFLFVNMSILRQGIAIGFLLISFCILLKGNRLTAYFFCIAAVLFHFSAIIFIFIFIFISYFKLRKPVFLLASIGFLLLSVSGFSWIDFSFSLLDSILPHNMMLKFTNYASSDVFGKVRIIGLGALEKLTILFIVYRVLYKKRLAINNEAIIYLALISFLFSASYFLLMDASVFYNRIKFYFMAFNSVFILYVFLFLSRRNTVMFVFFIAVYSGYNLQNTLSYKPNNIVFLPYNTIISDSMSMERGYQRIDRARAEE